jgi:hypothetical protein
VPTELPAQRVNGWSSTIVRPSGIRNAAQLLSLELGTTYEDGTGTWTGRFAHVGAVPLGPQRSRPLHAASL